MSEKTLTVTYSQDEEHVARITVVNASARIGMTRSILAIRGVEQNAGRPSSSDPTKWDIEPEKDEAVAMLRANTYPDLVPPVVKGEGVILDNEGQPIDMSQVPLPFPDFIRVPDELIILWQNAVYETNPRWNPITIAEDLEKKARKSPSGS